MKKAVRDRAVTILAATTLLAAGFLAGSFWLEWRGATLEEAGREGVAALPSTVPEGWSDRVRVEVLNGMGEPGAARRVAERLRGMGFDVVFFGNADRFDHDSTRVLLRSQDRAAARRLADSLGLARVIDRPDPDLYLDGTVILGEDWRERMESRSEAAEAPGEGDGSLLDRFRERLGL